MQFLSGGVGGARSLRRGPQGEDVAERQAEQAERARLQEIAPFQPVAEMDRLVRIQLDHCAPPRKSG